MPRWPVRMDVLAPQFMTAPQIAHPGGWPEEQWLRRGSCARLMACPFTYRYFTNNPRISMPDRQHALALLEEWVENEGLRTHMRCVEAAVRHYARLKGADEELWGLAGLLHDLDWEKHPENHPNEAVGALREHGYPEEVLTAILAHRPDFTGVAPTSELDRVLFACDELSGLVYACCLVRPNGIDDLTPKSVVKKLKDKAFAAGVHREEVARGMELIGLERAEHIQNVIDGMRAVAADLGIRAVDLQRN